MDEKKKKTPTCGVKYKVINFWVDKFGLILILPLNSGHVAVMCDRKSFYSQFFFLFCKTSSFLCYGATNFRKFWDETAFIILVNDVENCLDYVPADIHDNLLLFSLDCEASLNRFFILSYIGTLEMLIF